MFIPGGYIFHPSRYSPPIGHDGLDIELTRSLRQGRGCLRAATFEVVTNAPRPILRTFQDVHGEDGEVETMRVCPGTFQLQAGNDDVTYGYTFGGRLRVSCRDEHTCGALTSRAPVFSLADGSDPSGVFLYSEFMVLLAYRRAVWGDDAAFGRRLAMVDPFTFFVATLVALDDRLARYRGSIWMDEYRRGSATVRRCIATLREAGEWPLAPPRLEDLI